MNTFLAYESGSYTLISMENASWLAVYTRKLAILDTFMRIQKAIDQARERNNDSDDDSGDGTDSD